MSDLDKRVKTLKYGGFYPPHTEVEIAYRVEGNKIIFTALQNVVKGKTSTINAAEEIIALICEKENLNWRECEFYDLQTWVGYPHHGHGYFCLDQLIYSDDVDYLHVWRWEKRASSDDHPDYLNDVPRQMVKLLFGGE